MYISERHMSVIRCYYRQHPITDLLLRKKINSCKESPPEHRAVSCAPQRLKPAAFAGHRPARDLHRTSEVDVLDQRWFSAPASTPTPTRSTLRTVFGIARACCLPPTTSARLDRFRFASKRLPLCRWNLVARDRTGLLSPASAQLPRPGDLDWPRKSRIPGGAVGDDAGACSR